MSALGGALGIAGALAGSAAGFLGAQSANRAGRQARDWSNARTSEGMDRLLGFLYGQQGIDARSGGRGSTIDDTGVKLANAMGGSLDSQLRNNVRMSRVTGNRIVGDYNAGAQASDALARGAEGIAANYGRGAEDLIDVDMGRALEGANRLAMAQLASRGLGNSTLVGNQISENGINAAREGLRQKIGVRRDTTDRVLQARSQTLANTRANTAGRTGIQAANLDRTMQLRTGRQNTLLSAMNSGIMNPWLGASTTQYYPGYSSLGSGLNGLAQGLSGAGGFIAGGGLGGGGSGGNYQNDPMYQAHRDYRG